MAKTLEKALKTDMSRLPLRKAAEQLRKKGRGRDTVLAHITPREAARLKAEGGSGTINPDTGLPEFEDSFWAGQDFTLPAEISQPIETGAFTYSPVQQPETFTQPPFGAGVDQASVDATRATYGQGPYGAITGNIGTGANAPYYDAQLAEALPQSGVYGQLFAQAANQGDIPYPVARPDAIAAINAAAPGGTIPANALAFMPDTAGKTADQVAAEEAGARGDMTVKQQDTAGKTPGGIQTPLGNIATKDLIAALGVGGLGLTTLLGQSQAKKAAAAQQAAYNQAAAQTQALAAPLGQQASQAYGLYQQGALTPANLQAEQIARAQIAQAGASSGGAVGSIQAGEAMARVRQNLLDSQLAAANSIFTQGYNPLMAQAIKDELTGQITGIQTGLDMSAKLGSSAAQMAGLLAMMYARS